MSSIKIKGIGKAYLKTMGVQDEYGILQRFKEIENDIWGGDPPDKEDTMRAFIDGLINIISEIREGIGKKDAETEVKNANQLVDKVKELTDRKMISKEISRKTTAKIVEGLETKSGGTPDKTRTKTPGKLNVFETFLCCLLMADSLETNEGDVFSGVFKSWNRLQKLDQVGEEELQEFFREETVNNWINRNRSENVKTGFQRMISLISKAGNKALEMGIVHSFCVKEEVIRDEFYQWLKKCRITRPRFTHCYVSVKKLLPEFDTFTQTNDNLEHHLKWEVEDVEKMLTVFGLSRPSFAETEIGANQKQLANLWNQVKNKLNGPKERNRFTESPKVTTPDDATDSSSNHGQIKCLQINLNRSNEAWKELIHQWLDKGKVDVVFIQEPCLKKIGNEQPNDCCYCFPGLPTNYRAVHNNYLMGEDKKSKYDRSAAIRVHVDVKFERILPIALPSDKHPQELMVAIRLTGNGWDGVTLFSIYCRPSRSLALLLKPLRSLSNHDMTRTVLCMDANATHPNWSPNWEDKGLYSGRGEDLEDFLAFCNLQVAKKKPIKKQATEENEGDTSDEDTTEENNDSERNSKHIDVTLYGTKLWIAKWERLEVKSLSDHRYITFSIRIRTYPGENSKKSSTLLSALGGGSMPCLGRNTNSATKGHQSDNSPTNEE